MHGNQKAALFMDNYIHEAMKIGNDEIDLFNNSDRSILPDPPVIELSNEIHNYIKCTDAKRILHKNCWNYYRNDLELFKGTAESQELHDLSRLIKAELSYLTKFPL